MTWQCKCPSRCIRPKKAAKNSSGTALQLLLPECLHAVIVAGLIICILYNTQILVETQIFKLSLTALSHMQTQTYQMLQTSPAGAHAFPTYSPYEGPTALRAPHWLHPGSIHCQMSDYITKFLASSQCGVQVRRTFAAIQTNTCEHYHTNWPVQVQQQCAANQKQHLPELK